MLSLGLQTWAAVGLAVRRLLTQKGLALATAIGLVVGVALALSIPLYADAVYARALRERLSSGGAFTYPPFTFLFRYFGAWEGGVQWESVASADAYLTGPAAAELGLPRNLLVRYFKTDTFQLLPQTGRASGGSTNQPAWVSFAFISGLDEHVTLVDGRFPEPADSAPGSAVEALVAESLSRRLGLQVGETYLSSYRASATSGATGIQIPVRVAGLWQAIDPREDYWINDPAVMDDLLLVPEASFANRISQALDDEVYLAQWYLVLDGSRVRANTVDPLVSRMVIVQQRAGSYLPGTQLAVSPEDKLHAYQRAAGLLTILLYAFSLPVLSLILAFIGLVSGLVVERQRNEIAVLRSRGATLLQIVAITVVEGVLLGILALILGTPLGMAIAALLGRARSFLDFGAAPALDVGLNPEMLRFGAVAVGLALVALVVPAIGAARHTIITYKQERARALRPPWWQRAWLDVLLLIPAAYGFYLLQKQGSLVLPLGGAVADPFQNPLLLLVPALGLFALTLLLLRLVPWVTAGLAWLVAHTDSVSLLLAARHLSRTPAFYTTPLLLLVLTLSLSTFTASLAVTLDNHLDAQAHYRSGGDMELAEIGELEGAAPIGTPAGIAANLSRDSLGGWLFLPVSEHLKIPGVRGATRVGRFTATGLLGGREIESTFIGIDRLDFPQVAFWRRDFSPDPLGTLMNALAVAPDGVLMRRGVMGRYALGLGDSVRVKVDMTEPSTQATELNLKIVGSLDLFPTWYPEDGPLFVGNLDYLFEQAGGEFPYHVWLKLDPQADPEKIARGVKDLGVTALEKASARPFIDEEQRRPERQGLFGMLSVGFGAAALLTVLGFFLYALFSFRRRFIELGVLRALGLSTRQMAIFLAWELAGLIGLGLAAGTGLGVWVSQLFIPYLQLGSTSLARIPPFAVTIAWPAIFRIYALFGLLFLGALGALVVLLRRMRIFEAIKLGETA